MKITKSLVKCIVIRIGIILFLNACATSPYSPEPSIETVLPTQYSENNESQRKENERAAAEEERQRIEEEKKAAEERRLEEKLAADKKRLELIKEKVKPAFFTGDFNWLETQCRKKNMPACNAYLVLRNELDEDKLREICNSEELGFGCEQLEAFNISFKDQLQECIDLQSSKGPMSFGCATYTRQDKYCRVDRIKHVCEELVAKSKGLVAETEYQKVLCGLGSQSSCDIVKRQAAYEKVKCGFSTRQIRKALGNEDDSRICESGSYEFLKYGRMWILLKAGGAFAIQDHGEFQNSCGYYFGKYLSICGD